MYSLFFFFQNFITTIDTVISIHLCHACPRVDRAIDIAVCVFELQYERFSIKHFIALALPDKTKLLAAVFRFHFFFFSHHDKHFHACVRRKTLELFSNSRILIKPRIISEHLVVLLSFFFSPFLSSSPVLHFPISGRLLKAKRSTIPSSSASRNVNIRATKFLSGYDL